MLFTQSVVAPISSERNNIMSLLHRYLGIGKLELVFSSRGNLVAQGTLKQYPGSLHCHTGEGQVVVKGAAKLTTVWRETHHRE